MSKMQITFKNPEEIVAFVNTVSKYDFDMDMRKGRAVVDAKSLLGIMHLGLNNVIELQMYSDPGNSRDRRCGVSEFLFCKNPVSCIWETVEIDGAEYRSFFVAKTW